jgi:hypothetical protein
VFDGRLLRPLVEDAAPVNYEELVRTFGFQSTEQASNALITAKRMFGRQLRFLIGEYAEDAAAVEAEIAELKRILIRVGTQLPLARPTNDKGMGSLRVAPAVAGPDHKASRPACPGCRAEARSEARPR